MKQDAKNKELQERQKYVPASMKVINVTAQRVLCLSKTGFSFGDGGDTVLRGEDLVWE